MGRSRKEAPAAVLKMNADRADLVIAALRDWADAEEDDPEGVESDVLMARQMANGVERSLAERRRLQNKRREVAEQSQEEILQAFKDQQAQRAQPRSQGPAYVPPVRGKGKWVEDPHDPDLLILL